MRECYSTISANGYEGVMGVMLGFLSLVSRAGCWRDTRRDVSPRGCLVCEEQGVMDHELSCPHIALMETLEEQLHARHRDVGRWPVDLDPLQYEMTKRRTKRGCH